MVADHHGDHEQSGAEEDGYASDDGDKVLDIDGDGRLLVAPARDQVGNAADDGTVTRIDDDDHPYGW